MTEVCVGCDASLESSETVYRTCNDVLGGGGEIEISYCRACFNRLGTNDSKGGA